MKCLTYFHVHVALACLLTADGLGAEGQDSSTLASVRWTQFRGPNASGIATAKAEMPIEFGPDKNVSWKTEIPPGGSSPCIWEDRIFLTTYDNQAKKLEVICIDRSDGKIHWRRDVEAKTIEKIHAASTPASATPTTDGERVYVYFGSRGLLCYDFAGDLVWSIDMPVPQTRNGSGTSPIIAGDLVLLNREVPKDSHLLAVNKVSGDVVWKHSHLFAPGILNEGYATPIIWKDQVILHTHDGIRAITLSDGQLIWQVNASTAGVSTPVIDGNRLLVATFQTLGEPSLRKELPTFEQLKEHDADDDGTIAFAEFPDKYLLFDRPEASDEKGVNVRLKMVLGMVDTDKDREVTPQEWEAFGQGFSAYVKDHGLLSIELGGEGNVTDTHVSILEKRNLPEVPSPLVHQGRIYMIKNGGILTCLDSASKEKLYQKRISASGSYYASPIAVGENIYLASRQGVVTVLRGGDTLDIVAENDLSEKIMATPAVTDNTLYVRTDRHLYAFSSHNP